MIVGDRKPLEEIKEEVKGCRKLLILGCGTCVAVCMAGGEKEVELLASQMRMANKMAGQDVEILEATIQRQCDKEYFEPILEKARSCDAVLSMACGAGVQMLADMIEPVTVLPALNTKFIGITLAEGVWSERCRACGNCLLADYGGICPMTMCPKSLVNGQCGGSSQGKCETSTDRDCAWVMIYNRLKKQGKLDKMKDLRPLKDYSAQSHPARVINEAYLKAEQEAAHAK